MKIILPNQEPSKAEKEEHERLHGLYVRDQQVKALADKIHHHRMMSGDACDQCIAMALRQLGREY